MFKITVFFISFLSVSVCFSQTNTCSLTVANLKLINGLKLSMSRSEVKRNFPGIGDKSVESNVSDANKTLIFFFNVDSSSSDRGKDQLSRFSAFIVPNDRPVSTFGFSMLINEITGIGLEFLDPHDSADQRSFFLSMSCNDFYLNATSPKMIFQGGADDKIWISMGNKKIESRYITTPLPTATPIKSDRPTVPISTADSSQQIVIKQNIGKSKTLPKNNDNKLNVFLKPIEKKAMGLCTLETLSPLRGVRLGMNLDEVRQIYPSMNFRNIDPPFVIHGEIKGETNNEISNEVTSPVNENLKGLKSIFLRFIRGKLSEINVNYLPEIEWSSILEFSETTGASLNLPKDAWGYFVYKGVGNNEGRMQCKGFEVVTSLLGFSDYAILVSVNNFEQKVELEKSTEMKKIEAQRKKEQEEKKKIFKP